MSAHAPHTSPDPTDSALPESDGQPGASPAAPGSPTATPGAVGNHAVADPRPVVLFDGVCGLCNRAVDIILAHDRGGVFRLGALQSPEAGPLLERVGLADAPLDSLVLVDGERALRRSDAALEIARRLGGGWRLAYGLRVLPRGLRDGAYDFVARNRYRWFGRRETCRAPTAEERTRFI